MGTWLCLHGNTTFPFYCVGLLCSPCINFAAMLSHSVDDTPWCLSNIPLSRCSHQGVASVTRHPTLWGQAALLQRLCHGPLTRRGAAPASLRHHQWPPWGKADWTWDSPTLGMRKEAFAKSVTASQVLTPASDSSGRVTLSGATAAPWGGRATKPVTHVHMPGPRPSL